MAAFIENIPFIEVNQPIGKFYVASMKTIDILEIARYDIRKIERDEVNDIDNYFGIQRKPAPGRLKEISDYVKFIDATFPTNIVISINSFENIEANVPVKNIDVKNNKLCIRRAGNIAQIIDGQHRLLGLQKAIEDDSLFSEKIREGFELSVTIYVDMDIENQSMVFATINKAQTKVNKSLVYDLYDLANSRSPYRTAHNIVRVLNENAKSPLKNKVKMLGVAEDSENETVAQATLVESITKYISRHPMKDRDALKKGLNLPIDNDKKLIFRRWFSENNDLLIARTLVNYFKVVKNKWPIPWEGNTILVKSTGMIALLRFLGDIFDGNSIDYSKEIDEEFFQNIFNEINITEEFNNINYPSGGTGQSRFRSQLKASLKLQD